jgi:hypothetical protein
VAALDAMLACSEDEGARPRLIWNDEFGFGYYPVDPADTPYDAAYWDKYVGYAATPLGDTLNRARCRLISRHYDGPVVDIGIGCGSFMKTRRDTWGYDVNPTAIAWLQSIGRFWDPYTRPCAAVSMWDSLEHIHWFPDLLAKVTDYAFVALPVFKDERDVKTSKHFRPTEHYWYFTTDGLQQVMRDLGWVCCEQNFAETVLGRESIASFAFERV